MDILLVMPSENSELLNTVIDSAALGLSTLNRVGIPVVRWFEDK